MPRQFVVGCYHMWMSKDSDFDKLKKDLESLIGDAKKIFQGVKEKVPSTEDLQESVEKHAKTHWVQYLAVAFVAGLVVGALFNGKKDK